jgi:hypothetical protein
VDTTEEIIQYAVDITEEQAIEIIADAINKHGRPHWIAVVPNRIRKLVPYPTLLEMMNNAGRVSVKRVEKYQSIIDWTQEHLFEQVTPQQIMDVGEISYPTALKFIGDRPDIFRKLKRGLYELRDPKTDRAKAV